MVVRTTRHLFAVPIIAALAVTSACSSDEASFGSGATDVAPSSSADRDSRSTIDDRSDGPATTTTISETRESETRGDDGDESTGSTTTVASPDPSDPRLDVLEPRVGTWVVGDAGEVDVDLTADGLVLVDVRAASGWQASVDEAAPDEIEVDFEQGNVEWEIEIQWENGILEIEIDQDIEPATPGVVQVGVAGSVEFDVGSNGLVLVGVNPEDDWNVAITTESSDEIEVLFANGLAEYEVEIQLDDGVIEIEVDFEVEGPFTP